MLLRQRIVQAMPFRLVEFAKWVVFRGNARTCVMCGAKVRRFRAQGLGYQVLEDLKVVGGMYKPDDVCPICHGSDRDRLVKHYLDTRWLPQRREAARILHVAPERSLSQYLTGLPDVDYIAGDIEPHLYRHLRSVRYLSLLELPFEDASIDLVLCNHVLEHVPEDQVAMREIRRVLAPGGLAILQVPLSLVLDRTREGDGSESRQEKIRLYGQEDHVRIYTPDDYVARLTEAGFEVERYRAAEADPDAVRALSLNPLEALHACRAPEASVVRAEAVGSA
ncbi:MAG: methyltransferase domain-containing protein [Pikeienuella sp.]